MNCGRNAVFVESLCHCIPVINLYCVLGVYARAVWRDVWNHDMGTLLGQERRVASANSLSLLDLPFKTLKLRKQDSCLKRIQAPIDSNAGMMIATILPMHTNLAHRFGQGIVIRK